MLQFVKKTDKAEVRQKLFDDSNKAMQRQAEQKKLAESKRIELEKKLAESKKLEAEKKLKEESANGEKMDKTKRSVFIHLFECIQARCQKYRLYCISVFQNFN